MDSIYDGTSVNDPVDQSRVQSHEEFVDELTSNYLNHTNQLSHECPSNIVEDYSNQITEELVSENDEQMRTPIEYTACQTKPDAPILPHCIPLYSNTGLKIPKNNEDIQSNTSRNLSESSVQSSKNSEPKSISTNYHDGYRIPAKYTKPYD
jgi:hypothetical protein